MIHIFHLDTGFADNYEIVDTPLIRSWFTSDGGVNGFLADLCDDPTDTSPHMRDSRIRLNLTGIHFHSNTAGWGSSLSICDTPAICPNPMPVFISHSSIQGYITATDPMKESIHVFFSRGQWLDCNDNNIPDPEPEDCTQFLGGVQHGHLYFVVKMEHMKLLIKLYGEIMKNTCRITGYQTYLLLLL
jgi:hypothetical protein